MFLEVRRASDENLIRNFTSLWWSHGTCRHGLTFRLLPEVMGGEYSDIGQYFDQCRTKRNIGTYDRGGQISVSEVDELLSEVIKFQEDVAEWLKRNHPKLI